MRRTINLISLLLVFLLLSTGTITASAFDNTNDQRDELVCGLDLDEDLDFYEYDERAAETTRYSVPSSVDLSQNDYFPPIKSQGSLGSCTSWATVYYQYGYQVAAMNNWDAAHDQTKRFSPTSVFNIVKNIIYINGQENASSSFDSNYYILNKHGAVRYSEFFPATYYSQSTVNHWCTNTAYLSNALRNRVSNYYLSNYGDTSIDKPVTSPDSSSINYMKYLLSTGHVLTISTHFGNSVQYGQNSFNCKGSTDWHFDWVSNGEIACIENVIQSDGSSTHALAVVGYDDSIWYDYNDNNIQDAFEMGAFKIANSWGESYGNDGYIWVMYDALNKKSMCDNWDNTNRREIFLSYNYRYINVESYDLDLVAEVALEHNNRRDIDLDVGVGALNNNYPSVQVGTLFYGNGGDYPICGKDLSPSATIPFDFRTVDTNGSHVRKRYFIRTKDIDNNYNNDYTTIHGIQLFDKSGHMVVDDTSSTLIGDGQNDLRKYRIGLLGDVDNNSTIDTVDVTLIQRTIYELYSPSNEDLISSDVNDDGIVELFDVLAVQRYLAHLSMPNAVENGYFTGGYLVNLDKDVPICDYQTERQNFINQ